MSQPMLTIEQDQASQQVKGMPNLLPCRIHHTGPADPVSPHWKPAPAAEGTTTSVAYFRGRKLHGKVVALPDQCRGVLVGRKPQDGGQKPSEQDGDTVETAAMQVTTGFDSMVVWSHEDVADSASDPYIRSIEEWLPVAEQIHSLKS
ncbi:Uncharacterized protein C12B10.15c [Tolypocladium ophioglossoides CBS 100239]|uniref:Uncharacterized protein C12B10.15c n=1 Tax=Tolypocladium ophioglossoides (strain CBS 100239) TaxID=1163406 RepID=A0A0L0NBN6_TOLOC|nr:Uncharacterized protein C12B10.15c [Tolypocladium ophioglossoides CBS 100239]